jgi:hypothetical protein
MSAKKIGETYMCIAFIGNGSDRQGIKPYDIVKIKSVQERDSDNNDDILLVESISMQNYGICGYCTAAELEPIQEASK